MSIVEMEPCDVRGAGLRLAPVFLFLMLLLSCRTAPPMMPPAHDEEVFIPMEPGGFAYIFIDVINARPILDTISFRGLDTGDRQFRRILDSTQSATAAVFMPGEGEGALTRFRLAAQGSYPSGRARFAMRCSRHWRGRRSPATGDRYWHSSEGMISVSMNRRQALVSTTFDDGAPVDPFYVGPGTLVPAGFDRFRAGAVVSSWLGDPGAFLNQRLRDMHIPIEIPAEQFFVGLFPAAESQYVANIRIQVENDVQAGGFARVLSALSAARSMFAPAEDGTLATMMASVLLANPTEARDRYLYIKTDTMNAEDVSLLFNMFSP